MYNHPAPKPQEVRDLRWWCTACVLFIKYCIIIIKNCMRSRIPWPARRFRLSAPHQVLHTSIPFVPNLAPFFPVEEE